MRLPSLVIQGQARGQEQGQRQGYGQGQSQGQGRRLLVGSGDVEYMVDK